MGQPTQRATNYTARSNIDTAQIFLHANGQRPKRAMIRQRSRRWQRRGEPHTEHGLGLPALTALAQHISHSHSGIDEKRPMEKFVVLHPRRLGGAKRGLGGKIAGVGWSNSGTILNNVMAEQATRFGFRFVCLCMYVCMYVRFRGTSTRAYTRTQARGATPELRYMAWAGLIREPASSMAWPSRPPGCMLPTHYTHTHIDTNTPARAHIHGLTRYIDL